MEDGSLYAKGRQEKKERERELREHQERKMKMHALYDASPTAPQWLIW